LFLFTLRLPASSTLFPYTTLFRSRLEGASQLVPVAFDAFDHRHAGGTDHPVDAGGDVVLRPGVGSGFDRHVDDLETRLRVGYVDRDLRRAGLQADPLGVLLAGAGGESDGRLGGDVGAEDEIGRASCRERA